MMAYAKITQVLDKKVKLIFNSDNAESNIPYYYLSSYTPQIDDQVIVDKHTHCVIGKVTL